MLRGVDGPVPLGAASRLLAWNLEEIESARNPSPRSFEQPDNYRNGRDASWTKIEQLQQHAPVCAGEDTKKP
jgi:hypothetical protein